jgi:pilus assembly protein Flp/PilA
MRAFFRNESGATAIEYGLIVSLIVLVAIIGFQMVQGATKNTYNYVTNSIDNAESR